MEESENKLNLMFGSQLLNFNSAVSAHPEVKTYSMVFCAVQREIYY